MSVLDLSDTHEYTLDLLHARTREANDERELPWEQEIEIAIVDSPCKRCWKRNTQHLLRRPEFPLR